MAAQPVGFTFCLRRESQMQAPNLIGISVNCFYYSLINKYEFSWGQGQYKKNVNPKYVYNLEKRLFRLINQEITLEIVEVRVKSKKNPHRFFFLIMMIFIFYSCY